MKTEELKLLHKKKVSGLEVLVYIALKKLRSEDKKCPTNEQIIDILKGTAAQSISRAKTKLCQKEIICITGKNRSNDSKVFFAYHDKEEFDKQKKAASARTSRDPRDCGIYLIEFDDKIYIGQSTNIKDRWKEHRRKITSNTHRYIKEGSKYKFKILEKCEPYQLHARELLWAQRLYDREKEICNENNFTLIKEDK
jgi:hypothetical protein